MSSYYDEVALKGLQLAQADFDRDVLDIARMAKINETVIEFTEDLADQTDQAPSTDRSPTDAETAAAVEVTTDKTNPDLPVLQTEETKLAWREKQPVLCIAGRTPLDEAAGHMMSHLCRVHGIGARIEPSSALSTANIFSLDVSHVALVCLSYLSFENPSHMRYAIRRVRRKAPRAKIVLALWNADPAVADSIVESANAEAAVSSLRGAVKYYLDEAREPEADVGHLSSEGHASAKRMSV